MSLHLKAAAVIGSTRQHTVLLKRNLMEVAPFQSWISMCTNLLEVAEESVKSILHYLETWLHTVQTVHIVVHNAHVETVADQLKFQLFTVYKVRRRACLLNFVMHKLFDPIIHKQLSHLWWLWWHGHTSWALKITTTNLILNRNPIIKG